MSLTSEKSLWTRSSEAIIDAVMANDLLRELALKIADRRLYSALVEDNAHREPHRARMEKYYLLRNLFHSLNRALGQSRIAPAAREAILKVFIGKAVLREADRPAAFLQRYGFEPPGFLTISPGKRCNLRCAGCYAASSGADSECLDYDVLTRIVREKTESWGSHFTVISGGEPLMYHSRGKGILDLAGEHPDNYFMMYTNGTLIDPDVAGRMARVGNLSPAVSVEGLEAETDARRGKGVHRRILKTFAYLREAGVPFGISITATRHNADIVLSDPLIDHYFEEQGATYCWIFQYMPIGRSYTLDMMLTPEQRLAMFNRMERLVRERQVFIVDFWNSGPATNGCLAAGRDNGYFYIDWSGNVTPCVFFPYSVGNIVDIYRQGGHIDDVLRTPLFIQLREWQKDYGYRKRPCEMGNQIVPCPMRDHHGVALNMIVSCNASPTSPEAAAALQDAAYHEGMERYGCEVAKLMDSIWAKDYVGEDALPAFKDHPLVDTLHLGGRLRRRGRSFTGRQTG